MSEMTYKNSTYIQLSEEFRRVYPTAYYAFQLIPEMYNRLTLVEVSTHKAAIKKIREDHKELVGFSDRNIRRYLPRDNPSIPRRIRSQRPKSRHTESNEAPGLSNTKSMNLVEGYSEGHSSVEYYYPLVNQELEEANVPNSHTQVTHYRIPKEMFEILAQAMKKSLQICYVFFDANDELLKAVADIDK